MTIIKLLCFYFLFLAVSNFAQTDNPLLNVLNADSPAIKEVVGNSDLYQVQIIYTKIDRDENNNPTFTDFEFGVDKSVYFYPASTVKLPACILALEKLNEMGLPNVNKCTSLKIDSAYEGQTRIEFDKSSKNGLPSIGHYIKKILLVSDNDAFNRLYEFIGQEKLNTGLARRGFTDFRLVHRLAFGHSIEGNANSNPFTFYNDEGTLYEQPASINKNDFKLSLSKTLRGDGYIDPTGQLVAEPMEFNNKNFLSLPTLHELIKRIMFPESYNKSERFNLSENDYKFLYKYMSALPHEVSYPSYDSAHYDSYVKFFMFGDNKQPMPKNIRIFNKVGLAYGFITDAAYIVDFENNIEFIVSATLHVNNNKIYNDGKYEYDEIGIPFLAELGRQLYEYELSRDRKHFISLKRYDIH